MDEKLTELKEKQNEIGDKISLLRATNKKKDEEAAEIRQLIAECRENLNRIKGISPGSEGMVAPCAGIDLDEPGADSSGRGLQESGDLEGEAGEAGAGGATAGGGEPKRPCPRTSDRSCPRSSEEKRRCAELLSKREGKCGGDSKKKKKKGRDSERVSCKVDLAKMKVRIRGPSEDLKKLDATQLINLLEKFQCQELIINTGDNIMQDPGEVRLIYFMHPGNIVMVAGIMMMAFLINTNLCNVKSSPRTKFLLNVLYLSSFALHYGMVLWMSFIRGYALQFGLNQDTFHLVDNLILPKYFSVCVLLSALSLYSFLATHCTAPCTSWPLEVIAQMIVVVMTFFTELVTICYIIPAIIKLRDATDDFIMDDEDSECSMPESYEKNLTKLGKLKWTLCLINLLTLMFLGANIYYMTCKLNIGSAN